MKPVVSLALEMLREREQEMLRGLAHELTDMAQAGNKALAAEGLRLFNESLEHRLPRYSTTVHPLPEGVAARAYRPLHDVRAR